MSGAVSGNRTRIISLEGGGNSHYTMSAYGALYWSRTSDRLLRRQLLYPAELTARGVAFYMTTGR